MAAPSFSDLLSDLMMEQVQDTNPMNTTGAARRVIKYDFFETNPYTGPNGIHVWDYYSGWRAMTTTEKTLVREAFSIIESFLNVDFVEVNSSSIDSMMAIGVAQLNTLSTYTSGVTYNYWEYASASTISYWDTFTLFDTDWFTLDGWFDDTNRLNTILHEFGHALGLDHPFYDQIYGYPSKFDSDYENNHYTLMSYSQDPYSIGEDTWGYNSTMMLYDIWVLQQIWGAAPFNTGDTVYDGPRTDDVDVIWDTGGTDRLDASTERHGVILNLNEGRFSTFGDYEDLAIGFGVEIEGAVGSAYGDTILGNALANTISALGGADTVRGGSGDDTIAGDAGNDTLRGDLGQDDIDGGDGYDRIHGGSGNDALRGGINNDLIFGDDDNDAIWGEDGSDSLWGNEGNDTIRGGTGRDTMGGNDGDDTLYGEADDDIMRGHDGADTLDGGTGRDVMHGGDGDDRLYGGDDNDLIFGDADDDTIWGEDGADSLWGNAGNDTIRGGTGRDTMGGNDGNDTLYGEADDDIMRGHDGDDVMDGGTGNDRMHGGNDNDTLSGGDDNDLIFGDAGNDTIGGEDGNDSLWGNLGNDVIDGGDGDDMLGGNGGTDRLTGGIGADTFVFSVTDGADVVTDFEDGTDLLRFLGFGTIAEILAHASQSGSDVLFNFGADVLTVENLSLAALTADDLLAA